MSASVLYMSVSVDGYIAGPNDEPPKPETPDTRTVNVQDLVPDDERE